MNIVNWHGSSKNKFAFSDHNFTLAGFDVSRTEILNFFYLPKLIFCSFLDNVEIIVSKMCFWKEKWGSPTNRPLNSVNCD